MGLSAGSKQFNYFKKFNKFHKMLCKDEDMIDCRKTNRCFVLLLLAKTDQGRQLLWRLIFFFVSQRSSSSYILYPCHLTDAVSDKFVLVMKKQTVCKRNVSFTVSRNTIYAPRSFSCVYISVPINKTFF